MNASARRTRAGFWLAGMLVFAAAFLVFFRLVPWFYARTEPFYKVPVLLPSGKIVLRNDAMGDGHFGASRNNDRTHDGIDFASSLNEPVFAAKSGRVAFAAPRDGYGNFVEIAHPDGLRTRYAHLSQLSVGHGRWVKRGEAIGRIGKTGNAGSRLIEPHLHFEIRREDAPLNPMEWIEEGREAA